MTTRGKRDPATIAAQANHWLGAGNGAVVPALETASTFARDEHYALSGGYEYARDTNPTAAVAEDVLAAISGAKDALLFNAGMAAITAVFETLRPGQHVVAQNMMYHGTRAWLRRIAETRGVAVTFFDAARQGSLAGAIRPGETVIVWIETLANPTWDVADISAAAEAAHTAGAMLAVDATVTPPCAIDPFSLGADLVFHSATKYLGGHSDLTAGALVTADPDARWTEIERVRTLVGSIISPFDAWLLVRGMRTLFVRYERAAENARALAHHFDGHPAVERVLYPGLSTHPGHALATRQMTSGFGAMVSLLVRGDFAEAQRVATATSVFIPATSLGGVESLIEHRKTIEGADSPVPDNLLRLSIGIERISDLIADLDTALAPLAGR